MRSIFLMRIFIVVSFVLGYFVGGIGGDSDIKRVAGLGTGMRNVSATLVVGPQNFSSNPGVTVILVVGALFMLIILMGIGGEMGRRGQSKAADTTAASHHPPRHCKTAGRCFIDLTAEHSAK